MTSPGPSRRINGLLIAGMILLGIPLIIKGVTVAGIQGDLRIVKAEAQKIYDAFDRYYERNGSFPNAYAEPRFEPETLEPLRRRGYYLGHVPSLLLQNRIDAFDSPDDRGKNQEYWFELSLERDPNVRILIARSDDAPLSGGRWCDGVFVYRRGSLKEL